MEKDDSDGMMEKSILAIFKEASFMGKELLLIQMVKWQKELGAEEKTNI